MAADGHFVVWVHLDAEIREGIDELHKEGEFVAGCGIDMLPNQFFLEFLHQFSDCLAGIGAIGHNRGMLRNSAYLPAFAYMGNVGLNAFIGGDLISSPDHGPEERFKYKWLHNQRFINIQSYAKLCNFANMKKVALALASGGPRGFAYIGAIEELQRRGYTITSVAGASAGALVGGIFAAGGIQQFKEWLCGLDPVKVMSLVDVSISLNSFVKGQRVMDAIKERVPDVNIEDMEIPFTAVATDLYTGEEVIFREGPLFEAIRASISIPSMFAPVKWQGRTLIDGGIANTFPLNRVQRTEGDILVGFNVNEIDAREINSFLSSRQALVDSEADVRAEARSLLKETIGADKDTVITNVKKGRRLVREAIGAKLEERKMVSDGREGWIPVGADETFGSILQRSFGLMNSTIARMGIELTPPDVLASLPYDSYHGVYGYSHAPEIIEKGRELMAAALDKYENAF